MLKNKTKNKTIINKTKIADTFFKRSLGLMFFPKNKFDFALIFDLKRETIAGASIHMFFVFFPIDVLFLDRDKKIVDLKTLKPFRMYSPKKKIRYVIELPIGKRDLYDLDDVLEW